MGIQLSATMIKTSGKPEKLEPRIQCVPISPIHSTSYALLRDVEEAYPFASNADDEPGAMLTSEQAFTMLDGWIKLAEDDDGPGFHTQSEATIDALRDARKLAKNGYAMILLDC